MENGYVTKAYLYKTIGLTLAAVAGLQVTGQWQVMAQHSESPHPVTSDRIVEAKQEVAEQVKETEARLSEQLDKGYEEQKALNGKLDWIIQQMVEDTRARGNTQ